jgi:hypothetical protein
MRWYYLAIALAGVVSITFLDLSLSGSPAHVAASSAVGYAIGGLWAGTRRRKR